MKKHVLVIGAGTGTLQAYMLERMDEFFVTLADASDRLGGHINSLYFEVIGPDRYNPKHYQPLTFAQAQKGFKEGRNIVVAEGGAEFIGPPESYPNVHCLFDKLGVQLDSFAMSNHIHPLP